MRWVELLGYLASVLVAVSLMMSNVRRLRLVNLVGAIAFSTYGAMVGAWPVFGVNAFVVLVDLYYLKQMSRKSDFFTLMPAEQQSAFFRKFFLFHKEDIAKFFPEVLPEQLGETRGYFILRNMLPVGVFLFRVQDEKSVEIVVDYVIPEYRDQKNSEYVFHILNESLSVEGFSEFVIRSGVAAHRKYLVEAGFQQSQDGVFTKRII